jgi:hypothetical protein
MKLWVKENINVIAWGIFTVTSALSIWGWSNNGTDITNLYRLFPLLGLLAFSTMWGHYAVWALREWSASEVVTAPYSRFTQWFVLFCIIAHPALLIYQLNADGLGTPPQSYEAYVGTSLVGFVFLGTVCLFAFLAYELKRWLHDKAVVWKVVMIANHLAMVGIVIHSIQLGNSLKTAPLKFVWPVYGVTLVGIYIYLASRKKLV